MIQIHVYVSDALPQSFLHMLVVAKKVMLDFLKRQLWSDSQGEFFAFFEPGEVAPESLDPDLDYAWIDKESGLDVFQAARLIHTYRATLCPHMQMDPPLQIEITLGLDPEEYFPTGVLSKDLITMVKKMLESHGFEDTEFSIVMKGMEYLEIKHPLLRD